MAAELLPTAATFSCPCSCPHVCRRLRRSAAGEASCGEGHLHLNRVCNCQSLSPCNGQGQRDLSVSFLAPSQKNNPLPFTVDLEGLCSPLASPSAGRAYLLFTATSWPLVPPVDAP